jgi:hypothetical protein
VDNAAGGQDSSLIKPDSHIQRLASASIAATATSVDAPFATASLTRAMKASSGTPAAIAGADSMVNRSLTPDKAAPSLDVDSQSLNFGLVAVAEGVAGLVVVPLLSVDDCPGFAVSAPEDVPETGLPPPEPPPAESLPEPPGSGTTTGGFGLPDEPPPLDPCPPD